MNGIKMSDCKFYVNEAERVVVCVIPNTQCMVERFIYEHFRWRDFDMVDLMTYYTEQSLYMPDSFMGKAVCSADDEWDEELGRMIAFSRAKDKCYRSFFKRANQYINALDRRLGEMVSTFNDLGSKLDAKREALERQIEERVNK